MTLTVFYGFACETGNVHEEVSFLSALITYNQGSSHIAE